jgi:hypothetical protein
MSAQTRYELICHPLFLAVAGGLNFPPLVFGVLGVTTWCDYYSSWLIGNACLTALNMAAALISVFKIRKISYPPPVEQASSQRDSEKDEADPGSNSERSENDSASPADPEVAVRSGCFSRLIHLRTRSSDRIRHLICYDGIIATYSIIFLVWVFWISEGTQRRNQLDMAEEEQLKGCVEFHERYVEISLVCGFTYFSFVVIAALASLC